MNKREYAQVNKNWLTAKAQEEAEKNRDETIRDTELDVVLCVDDFNKRHDITENSRRSLNIAQEAYDAMLTRFIKGQATVNDLSLAQN